MAKKPAKPAAVPVKKVTKAKTAKVTKVVKPAKVVKRAKVTKPTKVTEVLRAIMTAKPKRKPAPPAAAVVLDRLWSVILDRRSADPAVSHSARLLSRGPAKVAQKFGEEAVECLIEAVAGNKTALIGESADVLYHLLVLWVASGVEPAQVWAELERREGVSGVAEKAARPLPRGLGTTKIP